MSRWSEWDEFLRDLRSPCPRCGADKSKGSVMSKFNTEQICMRCKDKEMKHPRYAEADRAEVEAVRKGVRNFPGIGKPSDL